MQVHWVYHTHFLWSFYNGCPNFCNMISVFHRVHTACPSVFNNSATTQKDWGSCRFSLFQPTHHSQNYFGGSTKISLIVLPSWSPGATMTACTICLQPIHKGHPRIMNNGLVNYFNFVCTLYRQPTYPDGTRPFKTFTYKPGFLFLGCFLKFWVLRPLPLKKKNTEKVWMQLSQHCRRTNAC